MINKVIAKGTASTAITYEGFNFLEIKRLVGGRIEKANKFQDRGILLLDTPYGVQKVNPGDVILNQGGYWRVITPDEFKERYEIIK